jgi:hypothetical protein
MEDDNGIEGHVERKKKEQTVQWIDNGMLRVGEERVTGELIRVPKRNITILNAFYPEESRGDEIGTEVSFREEVSPIKQVIEKEEGAKKKG